MVTLKSALMTMERLLLPGFLICFETIFLVLFGLLVRYDDRGSPDAELAKARQLAEAGDRTDFVRELESTLSTTKTYPCKLQCSAVPGPSGIIAQGPCMHWVVLLH